MNGRALKIHYWFRIGPLHSSDVLLQNVPDRSRAEMGNLVEDHLCRLMCVLQDTWNTWSNELSVCVLC